MKSPGLKMPKKFLKLELMFASHAHETLNTNPTRVETVERCSLVISNTY